MKSNHKVIRYDYSKYKSDDLWNSKFLDEYEFWGIHPKHGRLHIDTKRYKEECTNIGICDFLPNGLFKGRNSVYYVPTRKERYDYKINIFRDSIASLKKDWEEEYKPVFNKIKTPSQVEDDNRTEHLMTMSCSDDYDDIEVEAKMAAFKRIKKYDEIIQALYCQFICKIASEIDRFTLKVIAKCGFQKSDYSYRSFETFTYHLSNVNKDKKISDLNEYDEYYKLRLINDFLKHNSLRSYGSLRKHFKDNVYSKDKYQNGMYAVNWVIIDDGYIDNIFGKLTVFFEDYCKTFLNEDIENSKWDYDDYFKNAIKKMSKKVFGFDLL